MICLLLLVTSLAVPASAAENLDPNRSCSLTFTMEYDGKKLNSGTLTIYQVGEVYADNGWHFRLVSGLRDSGLSIADLTVPDLASSLWTAVQEAKIPGNTGYIRNGKVSFTGLKCGLYLVTQTEQQASAKYEPILPFLISLPQTENDGYIYDFTAEPKVGIEPEPTPPPTTRPKGDLPQTGQLNWPVPAMAAGGMVLFALGWYLCFGKKEGYET